MQLTVRAVSLSANGSGNITETTGAITGTTSVTLASGTGNIGTSGNNILTTTPSLTASSRRRRKYLYYQYRGGHTERWRNRQVPAYLPLSDNNSITLGGPITGNAINLSTSANNGNIAIGAYNLTASGTSNQITLSANGSGNITDTSGLLTASTVTLSSTSGNLGTSGNSILTAASALNASTSSGNVYLSNTGAVTLSGISTGNTNTINVSNK